MGEIDFDKRYVERNWGFFKTAESAKQQLFRQIVL